MPNKFSEVTPEIKELAKKCNKKIDEELFFLCKDYRTVN